MFSAARKSALRMSNAVEKKAMPTRADSACSSSVLGFAELERFPMLAVGGAEAVLVVVRLVEHLAGVERAVVALLQLPRVDATFGRRVEQLLGRLHAALMVVADLRNHIRIAVIADDAIADDELTIHGLVPSSYEF